MVATTQLYQGPGIAGLAGVRGQVRQYMAYEPGSTEHWSIQGTFEPEEHTAPFLGGARLTSGFWSHESFRFGRWLLGPHGGNDFIPLDPTAEPKPMVRIMFPGRCVARTFSEGTGNLVVTQVAPRTYVLYGHMESLLSGFAVGDELGVDQVIGPMGDTGTFATGKHLHASGFVMPTDHHSWENAAARRYFDLLPYMGALFLPEPEAGITLGRWQGGLARVLDHEALQYGLRSVSVTRAGRLVTYVPGAPAFVNEAFLELYPETWIPPDTAVLCAA